MRRRARTFAATFGIVAVALAVVALGGAAATNLQGPRVTDAHVDPDAAVSASGSRIIFTTTQSLDEVTPEQVTVTPAADFTVDTSGRSVGLRFALPLWDDTDYTVRIDGVTGLGGGPASTIEHSFTTPPLDVYILQRGAERDTVYRTDLAGDAAVAVFTHPHIEDFRATASHLVMATVDDDGHSRLIVTAPDGTGERTLPLPGDGVVGDLQSADRGDLIGYTFTDADIGADSGRESALFTASLADAEADADPRAIDRPGGDSRVDDWRFVPDTDAILMLTFDGALTLVTAPASANAGSADTGAPSDPVSLGTAVAIDSIARGSSVAIVERADGPVAIDLATAEEEPLVATAPEHGQAWSTLALADGSTVRAMSVLDADGITVERTAVAVVAPEGGDEVRAVFEVAEADALLQVCLSPSNRYAALLVAPAIVDNPYDGYLLPLPERVQTHVIDLSTADEVVALRGFDISWCQTGPRG
ncbi:MAG: hypothetical protein EOO67_02690 [Microbacterium sp.]|nr:MAG: hypothetical protein EOO67_02690 [Microbacterium sp.]